MFNIVKQPCATIRAVRQLLGSLNKHQELLVIEDLLGHVGLPPTLYQGGVSVKVSLRPNSTKQTITY